MRVSFADTNLYLNYDKHEEWLITCVWSSWVESKLSSHSSDKVQRFLVFSLLVLFGYIFNFYLFQHPIIVHGISSWTIHKKRSNRCSWQTLSNFERCWGGYSLHIILPVHILQCHSGLGNALPHVIISIPSPLVTLQQWVRKIDNFKQFFSPEKMLQW